MRSALRSVWQRAWLALQPRFGEESGAVAAEYVLLLTLIAMAIVGSATALGLALAGKYTSASDCVQTLAC